MTTTTPSPQSQLESLTSSYQTLQTSLQTQIASRQRLESQSQENTSVQKEFSNLDDDTKIYKLIGPVLLRQEKAEAEQAVGGRLEFIGKEIKRVEGLITEMQSQSESKKMEIYQLQMSMQQESGKEA
ncbi:MAG: hypothetical protein Q9183_007648 [Haloplaca sp. 2 TL-2023]